MKRYIGLFTAILVFICSEKAFVGDSASHIVRIKIHSKNRFDIIDRYERVCTVERALNSQNSLKPLHSYTIEWQTDPYMKKITYSILGSKQVSAVDIHTIRKNEGMKKLNLKVIGNVQFTLVDTY